MPFLRNEWKNLIKFIRSGHPQHLHKYSLSIQRSEIHEIPIKMQGREVQDDAKINPQKALKNRLIQGNVPRIQPMGGNRSRKIWK